MVAKAVYKCADHKYEWCSYDRSQKECCGRRSSVRLLLVVVMIITMEVVEMHLAAALAARYLGAVRAGEGLAHVLVDVADVGAERVLPREGLQADVAAQV